MRVGLDIDGTISAAPVLFAGIARSLIAQGHEVWIITGAGELSARVEQMGALGVPWTRLAVVDNGNPPHILGPIKARYCRAHSIDVMVDDFPEVVDACLADGTPAVLFTPPGGFS